MSACLCFIDWKEAMGRPNWYRSLAYSSALSRNFSAPPTISFARQAAACAIVRANGGAAPRCLHLDAAQIPASIRLGECQRRDTLTGGERWQQHGLLRLAAGIQDCGRRQDGRSEIGRRHQGTSHLLEHDAEFDKAETLAA